MCFVTTCRSAVTFLLIASAFTCGCDKSPSATQADTRNLKALGVLYGKYVGAHGGRRPNSESELIQYISTKEGEVLSHFGVDDPRKLLVSTRDAQPLNVVYGGGLIADQNPVAAFESQPTDGKRWVAWTTGSVMELNDVEFEKYKPTN